MSCQQVSASGALEGARTPHCWMRAVAIGIAETHEGRATGKNVGERSSVGSVGAKIVNRKTIGNVGTISHRVVFCPSEDLQICGDDVSTLKIASFPA